VGAGSSGSPSNRLGDPAGGGTQRFSGETRITLERKLENYRAGLPFPPETIDPNDPKGAIALAGHLKEGRFEDGTVSFVWYLDLQTLSPLYYAAYRKDGSSAGIGYFVSRWSEDRDGYPRWPEDPKRPVRTLDTVGAALVDWRDQHAVRIETGNQVSVPSSEQDLNRKISLSRARVR
jgi:hypothetical protein